MSLPDFLFTSPWLVRLLSLGIGACFGSFFTVAIGRWPDEGSVISPPSRCNACGKRLRNRDNIPIFGWLLRRGRAACCGTPISPRYLAIEVLTALFALVLVERQLGALAAGGDLRQQALYEVLGGGIFIGGLIIATFVDLETMMIPDEVTLGGGAALLTLAAFRTSLPPEAALIGAGLGYLIIQVPFVWVYEAAFGRRGMGEGDSKLMLFIGTFLGLAGCLFALVAGAVQGLLVFALFRIFSRNIDSTPESGRPGASADTNHDRSDHIEGLAANLAANDVAGSAQDNESAPSWRHVRLPFGPLLAVGALEYYFFGPAIIEWYLGLLSP